MLNKYKWRKRVLIIFSHDTEFMEDQKRLLKNVRSGIVDRDMILFGFNEDTPPFSLDPSVELDELRNSLSLKENTIVLLGKDGGVKAKWEKLVDPRTIFDIIDVMPMRQREMRERGR